MRNTLRLKKSLAGTNFNPNYSFLAIEALKKAIENYRQTHKR